MDAGFVAVFVMAGVCIFVDYDRRLKVLCDSDDNVGDNSNHAQDYDTDTSQECLKYSICDELSCVRTHCKWMWFHLSICQ